MNDEFITVPKIGCYTHIQELGIAQILYLLCTCHCAICMHIQVSLIIMLSLGSMQTDRVVSEPSYNEVIYNRDM